MYLDKKSTPDDNIVRGDPITLKKRCKNSRSKWFVFVLGISRGKNRFIVYEETIDFSSIASVQTVLREKKIKVQLRVKGKWAKWYKH